MTSYIQQISEKLNLRSRNKAHFTCTFTMWQKLREDGCDFAQWSDKELKEYDHKTGLIGNKCGMDCYLQEGF